LALQIQLNLALGLQGLTSLSSDAAGGVDGACRGGLWGYGSPSCAWT